MGASALGWAIIGFAGLADYPELLRVLADARAGARLLARLGRAWRSASGRARRARPRWRVGAGLIALCWREGRRGFDERSLALALAAALALSPIVWLHYFVLLLVPIALARRTFGPIWLIPALFWITPFEENFGARLAHRGRHRRWRRWRSARRRVARREARQYDPAL